MKGLPLQTNLQQRILPSGAVTKRIVSEKQYKKRRNEVTFVIPFICKGTIEFE